MRLPLPAFYMCCIAGSAIDRSRPYRGLTEMIQRNRLIYWRSLRDSNPCYSLERASNRQHRTTAHDRKHLENSLFFDNCPISSVMIRVRLVDIVDTTISRVQ